ncbi:MAG: hypothetical protein ACJAVO_002954 [Parvibaculaceae bacterium]|jgi:hypothetical protein
MSFIPNTQNPGKLPEQMYRNAQTGRIPGIFQNLMLQCKGPRPRHCNQDQEGF